MLQPVFPKNKDILLHNRVPLVSHLGNLTLVKHYYRIDSPYSNSPHYFNDVLFSSDGHSLRLRHPRDWEPSLTHLIPVHLRTTRSVPCHHEPVFHECPQTVCVWLFVKHIPELLDLRVQAPSIQATAPKSKTACGWRGGPAWPPSPLLSAAWPHLPPTLLSQPERWAQSPLPLTFTTLSFI